MASTKKIPAKSSIIPKKLNSVFIRVLTFWGVVLFQLVVLLLPLTVLRGGWATGWALLCLLASSFFFTYFITNED